METMLPQTEKTNSKVLYVVLIVIILIAGAFIFYYMRGGDMSFTYTISQSRQPSASDDVASIEKDLNATNVNNLTTETNAIDKELSAPVAK